MKNTTTKNTKKTVETVTTKNDSTIGRDNNKTVATVSSKEKTMKQTTNEQTKELTTIDSGIDEKFKKSIIKGGKKKNIREELTNYLTSQFNALYVTSKINTFQMKVSDVIKQFLEESDNKINASSYDLNALIQEITFELAKDYRETEKRIPCIKANSSNVAILMTCDKSKFDDFYSKNVKFEEAKAKAKATKEAKAKEEEATCEAWTTENISNGITIDSAEKATIAIMLLLEKYNNELDLQAIQKTIDTLLPSANVENVA